MEYSISNKQDQDQEQLGVEEDVFDKLPDHLLLSIFNKIHDAKSLCNTLSVSNRFRSLISQSDTVSLTVPRRLPTTTTNNNNNSTDPLNNNKSKELTNCDNPKKQYLLNRILNKLFLNPLKRLVKIATKKSSHPHCECEEEQNTLTLVSEVLKNFDSIKDLHIELPTHVGDIPSNLLKWKAEFGEKLESCVILGATSSSLHHKDEDRNHQQDQEEGSSSSYFSEEELKVRVVWIVSCLMAASARHYMLGGVVSEHRELERVLVTDGSKQGRICMGSRQVEELRNCGHDAESALMERSRVPGLKMKLWYVPELELKGGVMKGATLVVIRPSDVEKREGKITSDGELVRRAFCDGEDDAEKAFREAARKMMKKKKTYMLEMNSF